MIRILFALTLLFSTSAIADVDHVARGLAARITKASYIVECDGAADSTRIQSAVTAQKRIIIASSSCKLDVAVKIPNGGILDLECTNPAGVTFTADQDVQMFTRDTATFQTYVKGVRLRGKCIFDGEHERTSFPYSTIAGTYGALAFGLLAADPDATDSFVDIEGAEFRRFASIPYQFINFARASVRNTKFWKTKDPGYVSVRNVVHSDNVHEWSADNCVSVSRGTLRATITGNIFRECEIAGAWVSGYNVAGSGTLTANGTYTFGGTVTVTASVSSFTPAWKNNVVTLYDGSSNYGVVKLTAITSGTVATGIVLVAIPAGLQNIASASWYQAPQIGAADWTISNNVIVGAYEASIHAAIGAKRGTVANNVILRSGMIADSEIATTGTIAASSTSLALATGGGADFADNDWVIVQPENSLQDYFIAKVSSGGGTDTLTLDRASPRAYVSETVRLLHMQGTTGYGLYATGNNIPTHEYGGSFTAIGNRIEDFRTTAFYLGHSTNGSVKKVSIVDNDMFQPSAANLAGAYESVRVAEAGSTEAQDIIVERNRTDYSAVFFRGQQRGTTLRRWVVKDNYSPNVGATNILVATDLNNAGATVTGYNWSKTDDRGIAVPTAEKLNSWATATISAGVVNVTSSYLKITPSPDSGNVDITDLVNQLGSTGLGKFAIWNGGSTGTITIKHNGAKITSRAGADYVLNPGRVIEFEFKNANVATMNE
jgi:hypothetical protein